jgi:hypothetical protein
VIVAISVVEGDHILISRLAMPQIQKAIGAIVSIWLVVACAPQPPWGAIGGLPGLLVLVFAVHWIACATAAATAWTGDVDDPVGSTKWLCRCKKGLPVFTRARREKLGSLWARVLVK